MAASTVFAPELTAPVMSASEIADGYLNAQEASSIQVAVTLTNGMHAGDVVSVTVNGQLGYPLVTSHTITTADLAAGQVTIDLHPTALPQGGASLTATLTSGGDGATATSARHSRSIILWSIGAILPGAGT